MSANGYRDYFKVLGVDRSADADAVKKAFRKLARQYHPDVNPGDTGAAEISISTCSCRTILCGISRATSSRLISPSASMNWPSVVRCVWRPLMVKPR